MKTTKLFNIIDILPIIKEYNHTKIEPQKLETILQYTEEYTSTTIQDDIEADVDNSRDSRNNNDDNIDDDEGFDNKIGKEKIRIGELTEEYVADILQQYYPSYKIAKVKDFRGYDLILRNPKGNIEQHIEVKTIAHHKDSISFLITRNELNTALKLLETYNLYCASINYDPIKGTFEVTSIKCFSSKMSYLTDIYKEIKSLDYGLFTPETFEVKIPLELYNSLDIIY